MLELNCGGFTECSGFKTEGSVFSLDHPFIGVGNPKGLLMDVVNAAFRGIVGRKQRT